MWHFLYDPITLSTSISNDNNRINNVCIRNYIDKYINLLVLPWWCDKSIQSNNNPFHHEIFKLVRDLCLLLRVFDTYSTTTHQQLLTKQKSYIINILSTDIPIDEPCLESNFQGYIEYINFGLLECSDLAVILAILVTIKHSRTSNYINIIKKVFLKYMDRNKDHFFNQLITGILRIIHEQVKSPTNLLEGITPTISHAQMISTILSDIIPKNEIKSDVYRKHLKLFICDSIDYSLQEQTENIYPNIDFLECSLPFVLKLIDVDRIGKYGLLNYFNNKLKNSNYRKKRCPIINNFRYALKNSKYLHYHNINHHSITATQTTTIDEDTPNLSKYIDSCINNTDCSKITIITNDTHSQTDNETIDNFIIQSPSR